MTDLFLIAHKVRGEAAFDIAEQMRCPICDSSDKTRREENTNSCHDCEGDGFWWIVSTSGHRAYPFYNWELDKLCLLHDGPEEYVVDRTNLLGCPDPWPDHYPTRSSPKAESSGKSLLAALGLLPKVVRRL